MKKFFNFLAFAHSLAINKALNVSQVTQILYSKNKTDKSYISKMLNKKDGMQFTVYDAEKAMEALQTLYGNIHELSIE